MTLSIISHTSYVPDKNNGILDNLINEFGPNLEKLTKRQKQVFRAILAVHVTFERDELELYDAIEAVDPDIWEFAPTLALNIEAVAVELSDENIEGLIAAITQQLKQGCYQ